MIVYIWGNLTSDNFTPRPGKDTVGGPGQQAGLSASEAVPAGRKGQAIDIEKLRPPLKAIPDDTTQGGVAGHFALAPVNAKGEVDTEQLQDWARSRGTGRTHEFTQALLDAVVEPNVKVMNAMIVESTAILPPVARTEYLDRLETLRDEPTLRPEVWEELHRVVQEQLALLKADVRRMAPDVRVEEGRTQGKQFFLFSHCTFSIPGSDVDPVVAGITFTPAQDGVSVVADFSGEHTGDCIASVPTKTVRASREDLFDAARESARALCRSAEAIAAALADPLRAAE